MRRTLSPIPLSNIKPPSSVVLLTYLGSMSFSFLVNREKLLPLRERGYSCRPAVFSVGVMDSVPGSTPDSGVPEEMPTHTLVKLCEYVVIGEMSKTVKSAVYM